MPSSKDGRKVKWEVGNGSSGEMEEVYEPVEVLDQTPEEDANIGDIIEEDGKRAPEGEQVFTTERSHGVESNTEQTIGGGPSSSNHGNNPGGSKETTSRSTSSGSTQTGEDAPPPPPPPPVVEDATQDATGDGRPGTFIPAQPGAGQNQNEGVPAPTDDPGAEKGGSGKGSQPPTEHGGPGPSVSQGPASDPYDDKLGQAGAAAGTAAAMNMQNQQQNGEMDNPDELGQKDGIGDKPGSGLDNQPGADQKPGQGNQAQAGANAEAGQKPNPNDPSGGPGGNGYGALQNSQRGTNDPTANARRNLEHQNRAGGQPGGQKPQGNNSSNDTSGGNPLRQRLNNLRNKLNPFAGLRNRLSRPGLQKKDDDDDNRRKKGAAGDGSGQSSSHSSGAADLGKKIVSFIADHPYLMGLVIIVVTILLLVLESAVIEPGSNKNLASTSCVYELKGVVSTGTIKLDGLQVELINCDGTADNYEVIETVDFEKYAIGVALAEVSFSNTEYFKSQIIAARNFALKRNASMCPGSGPDTCFYGYNINTGKIRLRNCSNDQNYCDPEKPCYRKVREGKKALVGKEAEGQEGAYVWKGQLSEETKAAVYAAAEEVKGKILVDGDGNVVYTNFVDKDQKEWYRMATEENKTAEEIMVEYYSSSGATGYSSANCTTTGNIDYGNYVLSSEGHEILHEPLDGFLEKNGTSLESFASLIESNVKKNGYGTRNGVVAAAVTLIGELGNKYSVKVPYYWSGGHYDGVVVGPLGYWGSNSCHTTANGQSYDYCGLDCSGFVPWAIKNGGFDIGKMAASQFYTLSGAKKVTLSSSSAVVQPGDLLESSHHVILVVGIDETNKQYICAEAAGNAKGVLFTRRSFGESEYWGVNMDGYYETHVRSET